MLVEKPGVVVKSIVDFTDNVNIICRGVQISCEVSS